MLRLADLSDDSLVGEQIMGTAGDRLEGPQTTCPILSPARGRQVPTQAGHDPENYPQELPVAADRGLANIAGCCRCDDDPLTGHSGSLDAP